MGKRKIKWEVGDANMKPKDYKIAKELKERLSKVLHLIDFRVFGSRARGIPEGLCLSLVLKK